MYDSPMTPALTTKNALIKAALKLFVERGYEAVSTRDITQAAKANLASIPYYFNTKADLFFETVQYALAEDNKNEPIFSENETYKESDYRDGTILSIIIHRFLHKLLGQETQSICCVMFREIHNQHPETKKMRADLISHFYEHYSKPLSVFITELVMAINKKLTHESALKISDSIIAQCVFYVTHKAFIYHDEIVKNSGVNIHSSEFITETAQHIFQMSMLGIKNYKEKQK
jgi:AcrR family transcriptional regulator